MSSSRIPNKAAALKDQEQSQSLMELHTRSALVPPPKPDPSFRMISAV